MAESVDIKALVDAAAAAKEKAYCRYSNFRVGAAVLTEDKKVFSGCNVENASHGVGVCAERTAIVKAVSEGHRKIIACAVSGDMDEIITPCGMCRQALREFGPEMTISCANKDGKYKTFTMEELLPDSFGPEHLGF